MNKIFNVCDILFFSQYEFTDTGETRPHFALVLLPEKATKWQNSLLACVITSQQPKRMDFSLILDPKDYPCFSRLTYIHFHKRDLQSKVGLSKRDQPVSKLLKKDIPSAFKKLKRSLYARQDIGSIWYKAAIFYEWKKLLASI